METLKKIYERNKELDHIFMKKYEAQEPLYFEKNCIEFLVEFGEFVNETKFEKLGVFKYSKEDDTPAEKLPNQIHPKTKQSRFEKIMKLEKSISKIKLEEKIGNEYDALIDGISENDEFYIARSYMDIPDEDGVIFIKNNRKNLVGDFIKCKITEVIDYDLIGEQI